MQSIVESIIDTRIISLLEVISNNYPDKFDKKLISKELAYIKDHIDYKRSEPTLVKPIDKPIVKPIDSKQNNKHNNNNNNNCCDDVSLQCSGRIWSNNIYNSKDLKKVDDVDIKFKVKDYKDINLKSFLDKYTIGLKCSKKKCDNSKYCKSHSNNLIHGDFLEKPSQELCYHFLKHGKYI